MHTKWPAVGEGLELSGSPEYTKYCACASTIAQRTGNAQLTKTPQVHEAMRLCIQNDPRSAEGEIGAGAQNAPSTAPVQQKYSEAW